MMDTHKPYSRPRPPHLDHTNELDVWIQGTDDENESEDEAEHFWDWKRVFPELSLLADNFQVIAEESLALERELKWTPWPEANLYNREDQRGEWKVVPLLYTFPATDASRSEWVESNCARAPKTVELLKRIPGIRTALFSRMGPSTRLSSHRGWADLANHVLRCHFTLRVPKEKHACGVWVEGHVQYHEVGKIIVFDDSHTHKAFNSSEEDDRVVLIFDVMRPMGMPLGVADKGHTDALDDFIDNFKQGLKIAMS